MSNDYYNASGWPVTLSFGSSVTGRSEMASIAAGFDKLAGLTGNASKFIRVNSGATAQEAVSATGTGNVVLASGATITTATITTATITGSTLDSSVIGGSSAAAGTFTTLAASSGTIGGSNIVTLSASQTLTNKTIVGASIGSGTLDNTVITGSTLNSTVIGGGTPAAGTFTTLTTTGTLTPQALVDISGASAGQIKFPATQNASANANTLDDYEEGTWTPTVSATVAGNLSVAYSVRVGAYTKIGRLVTVNFVIVTSSFTHTTASSLLLMTGLPFTSTSDSGGAGCLYGGVNKAGYTSVAPFVNSGTSQAYFNCAGMGVAGDNIQITDCPTAGTLQLSGQFSYYA